MDTLLPIHFLSQIVVDAYLSLLKTTDTDVLSIDFLYHLQKKTTLDIANWPVNKASNQLRTLIPMVDFKSLHSALAVVYKAERRIVIIDHKPERRCFITVLPLLLAWANTVFYSTANDVFKISERIDCTMSMEVSPVDSVIVMCYNALKITDMNSKVEFGSAAAMRSLMFISIVTGKITAENENDSVSTTPEVRVVSRDPRLRLPSVIARRGHGNEHQNGECTTAGNVPNPLPTSITDHATLGTSIINESEGLVDESLSATIITPTNAVHRSNGAPDDDNAKRRATPPEEHLV